MGSRMLDRRPPVRRCHYCGIVLNNKDFVTIALEELANAGVNPLRDICLRHGKTGEQIFDALRGITIAVCPARSPQEHMADIAFADLQFWLVLFWHGVQRIARFCLHAAIHPIRYYRYRQFWKEQKGAKP